MDRIMGPERTEAEAPRHGDQGDRGTQTHQGAIPEGLTITISREAGARGRAIGQRLGQRLGWQVYDRELLEFMANDPVALGELAEELTPVQKNWVEKEWTRLSARLGEKQLEGFVSLFRVMLSLGAKGRIILVGRGAHWVLPENHILRVRVVGAIEERANYLSQTLRLSRTEAQQRLRMRDQRRMEFAKSVFGQNIADPIHYDMVLHSSRLGEDGCAALIKEAVHLREGIGARIVRS